VDVPVVPDVPELLEVPEEEGPVALGETPPVIEPEADPIPDAEPEAEPFKSEAAMVEPAIVKAAQVNINFFIVTPYSTISIGKLLFAYKQ
jgi:hypothetical protein